MRGARATNKLRLDTWKVSRIEWVDPAGRFDSFAGMPQLYADYVQWAYRQSNGVWRPVHRRTFDAYVKRHVEVRRGKAIGWALNSVDLCSHRC